jgi:hypothetical protein
LKKEVTALESEFGKNALSAALTCRDGCQDGAIRVKKFCANSVYNTAINETGFVSPLPLSQALEQTIRHEFIEKHDGEPLYFSE